jgi:hypothetical protein
MNPFYKRHSVSEVMRISATLASATVFMGIVWGGLMLAPVVAGMCRFGYGGLIGPRADAGDEKKGRS